jgi:hypothetical protein
MAKVFVANGKSHAKKAGENARRNYLPLLVGNPTLRRSEMTKAKKKGSHLGKHHRKNPFIGNTMGNNAKLVAGAAAGFLGDVYLPSMVLGLMGKPDSGILSYVLAGAAVIAPAWLLAKWNMAKIAEGWLAGAGAGLVWRAVDDLTGQKLVQVSVQTPQGLSSFFIPQNQVLPGPNVFGAYARGRRMLNAAPSTSPSTAVGAGSATSVSSLSKPASGMGWARYPHAA